MSKLHAISALIATTLLINTTQASNTLRFISGKIYAAEVSTNNTLIGNAATPANKLESNADYRSFNSAKALKDIDPAKKSYLVLFVKLDYKRTLSIYDYSVVSGGQEYNCVSIAKNDDIFQPYDPTGVDEWTVSKSNIYYKMLFVIEQDKNTDGKTHGNFTLKYNLTSPATQLKFKAKLLGAAPFSTKGSLKGGQYAPEPKPAPAPTPAAEASGFATPKTDAELELYITGIWINQTTKEEIILSSNEKNKAQGWAIKDGALIKLADSTTDGTPIITVNQDEITIAGTKFTRKDLTAK